MSFDKKQFGLFLRFARYILPYRLRWTAILILSGLGTLSGLVNPYLAKLVIDKAIGNKDLKIFIILAVVGGAVFVISGVINGVRQYLGRYVKARVKLDLNKRVFTGINRLPFSWFQDRSTGENVYKMNYDINRVSDLMTTIPPQAAALSLKLVITFFIIFRLNRQMAVFSICLAPFLYLPQYYLTRKRRAVWEEFIKSSEQLFKMLHETFSHIYPIKVFGKEGSEIRKYLRKLVGNIKIELSTTRLEIFSGFTASALGKIIIGLITFYGGYQVIKGKMTLGSLTAIIVYLGQLAGIQGTFIDFFQTTVLGLISCQRVADILDTEESIKDIKGAKSVVFEKGDIVFDKVSFGYVQGKPVLKDLSFLIRGNTHISLAGYSGSGKTTLLNLIFRLYDPWQGEILIDRHKIKDIKLDSLKSQLGMVLQGPFLFNDTIKNNIAYGKQHAVESEIIQAANISLADEFVSNLKETYNTVIGENACKLSEGQKQKIAIARALIKKPKILIFDEAMSSMDSESEERILTNIRENLKGAALITVSHRLSTVKSADLIYFLKGPGEIIIGRYEELLQDDKDFYNLFKAQIK